MESVNIEIKKETAKVDRVVLEEGSVRNIELLLDQTNKALGDLVQISQKDLVNFLIQERAAILTDAEIGKLKSKHFDIVRALKRATQEVIKAKQNGSEIEIGDVLKILQTPGVSIVQSSKKRRGRGKRTDGSRDTQEENVVHNDADRVLEAASGAISRTLSSDSKLGKSQTSKSQYSP